MRIGIVCYPTFGGSGVLATELGKALADEGHQVHFITYQQPVRLNVFNTNIFYHEVRAVSYTHLFKVSPLVGPSSILLALMASGMNGQCFQFNGYLPIDSLEKRKKIKAIEEDSLRNQCTHLFIETPYRNNQLFADILQCCKPETRICIAKNITAPDEWIVTKTAKDWAKKIPELHKIPVCLLYTSRCV